MNNKIILLSLFFCSCIAFGQKRQQDYPQARQLGFIMPKDLQKVSIPFDIYNNLIVIDVLLNKSLPLKFILDTGVRTTVLTEKTLTDILQLKYARKITIPGVGGKKLVDAFVVNNVSLNIGEIGGNGHALVVLETDLLQLKNYLGVNVHGILGYELFSRFVVDINYDKKIVTFYNPNTYKKKKKYVEIPITIEDTKPYIEANLILRDSKTLKAKFMLDTGASHTMLLDERSSDDIYVPEPNISTTIGRGLAGDILGQIARVDKMWIGKYDFDGVITTFPNAESYQVPLNNTFRNGTFGGGMMMRFHIIFDYVNSKIYMRKGREFHWPFEYNLSGLIVKAKGIYLRKYEIENVRENSSAEAAGLKKGDEIIKINGYETNDHNLEEVIGWLNSKANRRMSLEVLRNGQTLKFRYKLARLI
jgi:hypothetical protein